jgi:5-methylcytosine-specific restriction endonuclease McrA
MAEFRPKPVADRMADCVMMLRRKDLWGGFPVAMRRFYLAQRSLCPYCGHKMPTIARQNGDAGHGLQKLLRVTWDHVWPRSRYPAKPKNRILSHHSCNQQKQDREPVACEALFLEVTNEIVGDIEAALP